MNFLSVASLHPVNKKLPSLFASATCTSSVSCVKTSVLFFVLTSKRKGEWVLGKTKTEFESLVKIRASIGLGESTKISWFCCLKFH